MKTNVSKLMEEYKKATKEMEDKLQSEFKTICSEIFKECPDLGCITWTQYIPGFNDGDPCTFTLGEVEGITKEGVESEEFEEFKDAYSFEEMPREYLMGSAPSEYVVKNALEAEQKKAAGKEIGWEQHYIDQINSWTSLSEDQRNQRKAFSDFSEIVRVIPESVLSNMFGDDVKVLVYPDRIDVEEFDCGY